VVRGAPGGGALGSIAGPNLNALPILKLTVMKPGALGREGRGQGEDEQQATQHRGGSSLTLVSLSRKRFQPHSNGCLHDRTVNLLQKPEKNLRSRRGVLSAP